MRVTNFQVYDSIAECLSACTVAWKAGRKQFFLRPTYTKWQWIGRNFEHDWSKVEQACLSYWQEGLDIIQEMLHEIDKNMHTLPPPVDRRRKRVWNQDGGDDIDMDRLRCGQDYWQRCQRVTTIAPAPITLVSDLLSPSSANSSDILWRGATAIVLCDLLEKVGYRVDLWTCACNDPHRIRERTFFAVKLKDMRQPIEIANVVNGMSGWFFRTVWFQAMHISKDRIPDEPGYGSGVVPWMREHPELINLLTVPNAKVVKIDNIWSTYAALTKVTEVINQLNKEVHA